MKTNLLKLAVAVATVLLSFVSFAQSAPPANADSLAAPSTGANMTIRISGDVHTSKGIPVPGARVRALHLTSGEAWEGSTDESGKFLLDGLPAGSYRLEIRHLGLATTTADVSVVAGSTGYVPVTLAGASTNAPAPDGQPKPSASPAPAVAGKIAPPASNQTSPKLHVSRKNTSSAKANGQHKQSAFAQVEPTGQLTASGELASASSQQSSTVESASARTSSADAFLIDGTVGRGATAQSGAGFDTLDDSSADDTSNGKHKKKRSTGDLSHTSHRNRETAPTSQALPATDNVEDLVVGQRLKHLGSNTVRFTLYDQYENSAWNAMPYSLNDPNPRKIAVYRERGGVSVGGPFVLPGIYNGRERTFFYANYELDRHRNAVDSFETVPLPEERLGNFTARGVTLYDPLSNLTGPRTSIGTVIPESRLNPTALRLLRFIPLPNLPGLVQNYHRQVALPQAMDRVNARILHTLSPKLSLQVSYNLAEFRGQNGTPYPSLSVSQSVRAQNVAIGLLQTWTPHLLNDIRFNFSRIRTRELSGFAFKENLAQQLGISGVSPAPIDYGLPVIGLTNYTGVSSSSPILDRKQTFRAMENFAYIFDKHTLRAGGEIRRRQINTFTSPTPNGEFTFSGLMTSQLDRSGEPVPNTGFDLADFLLGISETTNLQYGVSSNYLQGWWYVGYVQDDWRVRPRFSVNLGVRYEYVTPMVERYNHLVNLDLNSDITAVGVVVAGHAAPFSGALPFSLIRPEKNDWAPRIGIAWRPFNAGPVVRAGYGVFYNGSIYDQLATSMLNQPPFAIAQTSVTGPDRILTLANGFPAQPPDTVLNTVAVDPNYRVGYAQIWNLSVDTPITSTFDMEMTYTGTRGTHLDLLLAPNQATPGPVIGADLRRRIPNAQDFTYEAARATSLYDGLQVRVQRREAHGFRFLTLYTFGKSLDDASAIGVGSSNGLVQDYTNIRAEWGLSSFDVRHQLRNWLSYEPPFGAGKKWLRAGAAAALFGGWGINTITLISSGTHFTPLLSGLDVNGTGALYSQRPDLIGDPTLSAELRSPFHFFNTAAFAFPPLNRFGDAPRGSITGPGSVSLNLALSRRLRFGEDSQHRLEFRWEVQNVLNTVNYSGLSTVFDSVDFGRVKGARPMRTMDVFLRVHF